MLYPYNGILFGHKKESSTDRCYNMNEPQNIYAKWKSHHGAPHIIWSHWYRKSRIGNSIEIESRWAEG